MRGCPCLTRSKITTGVSDLSVVRVLSSRSFPVRCSNIGCRNIYTIARTKSIGRWLTALVYIKQLTSCAASARWNAEAPADSEKEPCKSHPTSQIHLYVSPRCGPIQCPGGRRSCRLWTWAWAYPYSMQLCHASCLSGTFGHGSCARYPHRFSIGC